jgi:hypothetical protein
MAGRTPTNLCKLRRTCHIWRTLLNLTSDEHYKRSEDCAFFTLIDNHSKAPPHKKAKAKRGSKASRLSTQSQFTTTSEAPSFLESPAEEGDSILTTATNTTSKKMAKAKKAPAKPRATRAKKEAPVEVVVALEPEDDDFTVKVAPKATRGKKRKSEEDIDPTPVEIAPPPAKRRTTRTRGSIAVDNSTLMTDDDTSQLVSAPKAKKGRASTRGKRNISNASAAKIDTSVPNDEDIDAALEADLEGRLTDDEAPAAEDVIMIENIEPIEGPSNPDHHMFGTESANIDEAAIEAELKAMEAESKPLPKAKGSKARQPRKVSAKQQATAKKAAAVQARAEAEAEAQRVAEYEASVQIASELEQSISLQHSGEDSVDSIASQSTVVKGGASRLKNSTKTTQKGKNVADDEVQMIDHKAQETLTVETDEPRSTKSLRVQDRSMTEDDFFTPGPEESLDEMIVSTPKFVNHHTSRVVEDAASSTSAVEAETHVPSKINGKGKAKVVVESPKSTTPPPLDTTPSQSPQSSDAENHPPSSKPSAASRVVATPATARRVPLGTVTPTMSPSKRNIIAGLQTLHPWTGVDLDSVFTQSPGGYNISVNTDAIFGKASVKNGLTSPEKQMTVDEWIHYNAQMAEEKLKAECERMVSNFENQGTRAMMALEGIECLE